ncbi:unnamed protein product [Fusarium graminearum]|uniref:Uncharacterized protein n=1 Tax=Gibberella zeae TaxID=5518 RepID=A0A4E9DPE7_GIBZA|nr:unnamed protein product [Fusarium graminearum]CAG1988658.1 unnamed protein product [Fusarium graminearum]CAG1996636.1 unnamed protein product [Fusarium graminearum]
MAMDGTVQQITARANGLQVGAGSRPKKRQLGDARIAIHSFDLVIKGNRGKSTWRQPRFGRLGQVLSCLFVWLQEQGGKYMHETQSERTWMGSILKEVQQQYSRPSPVANTSLKSHPLALIRRRSQSWPGAIKAIPNCFSNATYLNEGRLAVPFLVPARPPPALRCAVYRDWKR